MIMHKMTVDGNEYYLDPDLSVDETKNHVVDAVKSGGGLVDIQLADHATVSVLVSQRIPVTFETVEADENMSRGPDEDLWDWDYLLS
jgi:hypothetical protein